MDTRIKVCGLTRREDADLAAALGAWALGVIFASESPRRISREQAADVLKAVPEAVLRVGVFVNEEPGEIARAVEACGLTAIQLHGEESPEQCSEVGELTGVPVIKAIRVTDAGSIDRVVRFDTDYVLLDTYHPGQRGGTGRTFDWEEAERLPADVRAARVILSGGLNPDNVVGAVAVTRPFAVDLSSGIETSPGVKDKDRMKLLFERLRRSSR